MRKLITAAASIFLFTACNGGPNQTNIEIVTNMMDAPSVKAQGTVSEEPDTVQMRMPPDGAISQGHPPYAYLTDPAGAEKQVNPLAGDMSAETLSLGRKTYDIYCGLCHGDQGNGDGRIAAKMAVKPRNLMSAEALAYPDGRIFHAITAGKGVMGSYASQITDVRRRWAVVNYVRTLQKQKK